MSTIQGGVDLADPSSHNLVGRYPNQGSSAAQTYQSPQLQSAEIF